MLIVSMSLGHSVVFQVRRAPGDVPSSVTLDHGDILVMDGAAQSEFAHRTVSGLQGPRVNLSLPLGHTTRCVLSTSRRGGLCSPNVCARFSRAGLPRVGGAGRGGREGPLFGGLVLLLLILVFFLLVSTWIHIRRGASSQLSASMPPGCAPPLPGSCPLGRETSLATVTTPPISLE